VTKKAAAIDMDAGASVDFLRMKQAALTRELEGTIQSWSASREATENAVEERTKMLDVLNREQTATEALDAATKNVTVSTNQLVKTVEDGRVVWTNVGTAQKEAADVAVAAAEQFRNTISITYADGTKVIREVGVAAGEAAKAVEQVATVATETAPDVAAAFEKWAADGKIAAVKDDVVELLKILKDLPTTMGAVEKAAGSMNRELARTGEVSRAAAGAGGDRLGPPRD
jgi:hypothetical protein